MLSFLSAPPRPVLPELGVVAGVAPLPRGGVVVPVVSLLQPEPAGPGRPGVGARGRPAAARAAAHQRR